MLTAFLLLTLQAAAVVAPPPPPAGKIACTYSNAGVTVRKRFEHDKSVTLDKLFDNRDRIALTGMPVLAYRVSVDGKAGTLTIEQADFAMAIKGVQRGPASLRFHRTDRALTPALLFMPPLYTAPGQPIVYESSLGVTPAPAALVATLEGTTGALRLKVNSKGAAFDDEYLRISTADMAAAAAKALQKVKGAKDTTPRPC